MEHQLDSQPCWESAAWPPPPGPGVSAGAVALLGLRLHLTEGLVESCSAISGYCFSCHITIMTACHGGSQVLPGP